MILIYLFLTSILISVIGFYFLKRVSEKMKDWVIPFIMVGVITFVVSSIFVIVGTPIVSYEHIEDLESIQYYEEVIEIEEQRLERLKLLLSQFNYPESNLLNADSPIASTIEQLGETEKTIAENKAKLSEIEKNIRHRERWFYSYIPKFITR